MSAAISNGRKLAWKQDRVDTRDKHAKALLRVVPTTAPTAADNSDLVKVVDQGGLGSCTANASGQAVRAAELIELVEKDKADWIAGGNDPNSFNPGAALARWQAKLEFWSRLMSYYLARSYDHDTANDDGTEIRLIFQAINKYGFAPESAWPYNDDSSSGAPFSRMPPANAFRLAFDARDNVANENAGMISYARIATTGTARQAEIMTALGQRHLVVFGTLVTNQFCSDGSANNGRPIPRPTSASSNIAGGHALCIASGDQNGAGVVNSWGTALFNPQGLGGYGVRPGFCKFSWEYILWEETTDLWIVKRAPLLAAKAA